MNKQVNKSTPMPPRREKETKTYPIMNAEKIQKTVRKKCGNVFVYERHGKGNNKVFILPEAFQEFKIMVSYGRRSPMNRLEQKYAGYGHFFVNENGYVNIVVSHFIPILTTNRSSISAGNLGSKGEKNPGLDFLEYHRNEYHDYEEKYNVDAYGNQVDPFIQYGASEFVLEGHTHPDLGAFWSGTDKASGSARAATSPICIFVCDPIRKEMLGCIGKAFENAEVIVFDRKNFVAEQIESVQPTVTSSSIDEMVRIANTCLRMRGTSGKIKCRTCFNGKTLMKIKLIVPKQRKEECR